MERVDLFGIAIHNLTMQETLLSLRKCLSGPGRHYVVTPNVDHLVRLQQDPEFREVYRRASFVVADGMPLIWASRLLGRPLKERITGSDLVPEVCRIAAEGGHSVYFLGGNPGVAEKAGENLKKMIPPLRVAGSCAPPFGFERDPVKNQEVIRHVQEARPDVLFVALSAPKQEKWVARHIDRLPIKVAFCIGSALDYQAGTARRAPMWMRKGGCEWLWRLFLEPGRLAKRYLVDDTVFFWLFLQEWWKLNMAKGD